MAQTVLAREPGRLVLESCNSTWEFDLQRSRFRRVLRDPDLKLDRTSTAWRPYFGLEIDDGSEGFVVLLNEAGTRLLRSWRHVASCSHCGGDSTAELSLDELHSALIG